MLKRKLIREEKREVFSFFVFVFSPE